MMSTAAEVEQVAEAFFVFMGVTFGPLDLAILAILAAGGLYYVFGRNKSSSDAAAKFQDYAIQ